MEWAQEFDGLEIVVTCGGGQHRLSLCNGELRAPAHPDSAPRERALAALAGRRCECLEVVDKWDRGDESPELLPEGLREPARARAIASLGDPALGRRDGSFLRSLAEEELRDLARSAEAVTGVGPVQATIVVSLIPQGQAVLLGTARGRAVHVSARLPLAWWGSIWIRGLNRQPGRFCTGIDIRDAEHLRYVEWQVPPTPADGDAVLVEPETNVSLPSDTGETTA
jgi:hypothetical protein